MTFSAGGFRSRSNAKKGIQAVPPSSDSQSPRSQRSKTYEKSSSRFYYTPGGDPHDLLNVDLARAVAFDIIYRVNEEGAYANLALPQLLRDYRLKRRDAAFATELTYGLLRVQGVVDAVIAHCSSRPLPEIDKGVLAALRLGTYQLLYTRVDPYAAVDSTVTLVGAIGQEKAKGFSNAILRHISRKDKEKLLESLTPHGELEAIAFRHAHPEWIARSFAEILGLGELEEALHADSLRPTVHLVARPGEISAEELAAITGGEIGKYSPYAVYLKSGDPGRLEPVREGLAAVQDEGSQLIARALVEAELEGDDTGRWADLCAGPGGKTALIASLARMEGARVDAVELQPHRAQLVAQTVRNLPVTVHTADGRDSGLQPGFDRILVDAPCSGLGALRRRPEARWRKQEADITQLSTLQYELLESAITLVRPGGVVVYSTCSPDLRETRAIVDKAVEKLPVTECDAHPFALGMEQTGDELSVQMWPHRHGTDAMFFAVLRKN
ncbi:MFS transporter [Corynebacterium sp. ES2794-CONJ1]|uniref:RsmB/NOP family class I SAM-dependent RNA methyltransferase n=1 Tax=unclassified Corynebacterium TaxID=2624378 RepID=UPI00216A0226|nr:MULTISPECIES: transcription antitermination factor NusB [unclassified Corynebacterium]MCS4489276.1 MFS transporter [Corynebacterium sp. ES2775-CONJ]MCS4491089.1 MFS transporter [Corynebacterium sp. ES2715-CONJ3]MCS4531030.1 MFS transporter [Corynebacterium sp. ES2730-CONJ]MCU9518397.1 MFS transporter [Corynebacterium sp. ES2794-CONJ1]